MIWLPYMQTEIANHEPNLKKFLKVLFLLKKKDYFSTSSICNFKDIKTQIFEVPGLQNAQSSRIKVNYHNLSISIQLAFTCSKLTIETL